LDKPLASLGYALAIAPRGGDSSVADQKDAPISERPHLGKCGRDHQRGQPFPEPWLGASENFDTGSIPSQCLEIWSKGKRYSIAVWHLRRSGENRHVENKNYRLVLCRR
jgi:hypothetical protein